MNCSFCGKEAHDVEKMFMAEHSCICNECVHSCETVLNATYLKKKKEEFQKGLTIPTQFKKNLDKYVIGQDEAKKVLSVALYSHYKRIEQPIYKDIEIEKSNILLVGPTGSGKTLLAKSLAKMMGVPFAMADATAITEAGYVGEDVESILSRLLVAADFDIQKAQKGIVYIDEIDKIANHNEHTTSQKDISGEGTQQGLLKILEGTDVYVPLKENKKKASTETVLFDTTHVLFICGGAFVGLVPQKDSKGIHKKNEMGFVRKDSKKIEEKEIETKDFIQFGFIPEFIGRIPIITVLNPLSIEDLTRVLTQTKNSITKQYQALFELDGIQLEFSDDSLETIAQMANEKNLGARGLRGIIEKILLPLQYELPAKENIDFCRITKSFIEGKSEIELKR